MHLKKRSRLSAWNPPGQGILLEMEIECQAFKLANAAVDGFSTEI